METRSITSAITNAAKDAAAVNPLLGALVGIASILFGSAAVCREVPKIIDSASNASKSKKEN
ncbi:MAG: hypothetical protein MRZ39_04630 [Oscillospiraceae bacterium]|nr:hypothetical protein [Oscillospiraceae bacterium]